MNHGFPPVSTTETDPKQHLTKLAQKVNQINRGKFNCVASITLTASATTTVLHDERIGALSFVDLMPLTANAATAKPAVWVSSQQKGQLTLTHASSPNADQSFRALILG